MGVREETGASERTRIVPRDVSSFLVGENPGTAWGDLGTGLHGGYTRKWKGGAGYKQVFALSCLKKFTSAGLFPN